MPLYKGEEHIGKNIDTLVKEGYSRRQAIAIALSKAGKDDRSKQQDVSRGSK